MSYWEHLPLELKSQVTTFLIDDVVVKMKACCRVLLPLCDRKDNSRYFTVFWVCRKAVTLTGLHTLGLAFPGMLGVVEQLCRQRQAVSKKLLKDEHENQQLARLCREGFPRWRGAIGDPTFAIKDLMLEVAILDNLKVTGNVAP